MSCDTFRLFGDQMFSYAYSHFYFFMHWQLSKFVSLIRQAEKKVLQNIRSACLAFRLFAMKDLIRNDRKSFSSIDLR